MPCPQSLEVKCVSSIGTGIPALPPPCFESPSLGLCSPNCKRVKAALQRSAAKIKGDRTAEVWQVFSAVGEVLYMSKRPTGFWELVVRAAGATHRFFLSCGRTPKVRGRKNS